MITAKRILLIEDDKRVATALTARLRTAGYCVDAAPDPAFAVVLATSNRPDLIITDICLPVMQGFTFARRLGTFGLKDVPLIFITASQKDGLWETAMTFRPAGYFEKPYDPARLMEAVAKALQPVASGTQTAPAIHQPSL